MGLRCGVECARNHQHPCIILGVALGMGQAAHPTRWGQAAGQHGVQDSPALPRLVGRDGGLVQMGVLAADYAHVVGLRAVHFVSRSKQRLVINA